jgi:hypothetical protein
MLRSSLARLLTDRRSSERLKPGTPVRYILPRR